MLGSWLELISGREWVLVSGWQYVLISVCQCGGDLSVHRYICRRT